MSGPTRAGHRLVVKNAAEICVPDAEGAGVQRLTGHALYIEGGRVAWLGPQAELPASAHDAPEYDAADRAVLPALVDAHTHLVWGGDRVADFARRARGMTYAEIAAEGGGIVTTVKATRATPFADLLSAARRRLLDRARHGIGTTEIKSGYGLSVSHELRMLEVVAALRAEGFDVEATLLAAHTIPPDADRAEYLRAVREELIPEVARRGLARFADAFVERGAYTADEAREVFAAARAHGLMPRIHADQITAGGGAELAAEAGATSADHLEHVSDAGMAALKAAGVVAVLLPGAMTYLGDAAPKLGRRLVDTGVKVAVATDTNPGSSPTQNLPLMATLAVSQMGLTAEEALRAVTLGGAEALRRVDVGTLAVGALGRFIVLNSPDSRALVAAFGEPVVADLVLCEA
ncbi:MAG: imidazolonepropionase [Myxococcales bacterium]|nr:imidazolonepropionase [Myxococcales bacterium]MCB9646311.1 imidazolonepropionase [Deltaproteobacteria bacterium]